MVGPVLLAAVIGWGPRALSPAPEPVCPAPTPAPCVCVCQGAANPPAPPRRPAIVEQSPAAPIDYRRYSGPVVVADVLSIGVMLAAVSTKNAGLLFLGASGYSLGAPINHLANGRPGRALASFGMRTLALGLTTGVFIGEIVVRRCDGDVNPCGAPAAGMAIGTLIATGVAVLDDALLARVPVEPAPRSRATLMPNVFVGHNGALLSLSGRF